MDSNYIFKYVPFSINTLKMLIKGELWFGYPFNLNDPFEGEFIMENIDELPNDNFLTDFYKDDLGLPQSMVSEKVEAAKQSIQNFNTDFKAFIKKSIKEDYGICSFSKIPDNTLMWSHYSESHRGICLIFDRDILFESLKKTEPSMKTDKIDYKPYLPQIKVIIKNNMINLGISEEQAIKDIFLRKLDDWCKEEEIRFYFYSSFKNNRRSIPFDKRSLKGIIFGENMDEDDENTTAHLIKSDLRYDDSNNFWFNAKKNLITLQMDIEPYDFVLYGN
jgi:hypothetical protein